jgi:hypothetical protein
MGPLYQYFEVNPTRILDKQISHLKDKKFNFVSSLIVF